MIVVGTAGGIDRGDIARLCQRVRAALAVGDGALVVCDVSGLVAPDAVAVDALARMHLTARRLGGSLRVRHVGAELQQLLDLAGLSDVVCRAPGSGPA